MRDTLRPADFATYPTAAATLRRAVVAGIPEGELHAMFVPATGNEVRQVAPPRVRGYVQTGAVPPEFARVRAASLAIYAVPDSVTQLNPTLRQVDVAARAKAQGWFVSQEMPYKAQERAWFRHHVAGGQVMEIPRASHWLFISHPVETAAATRIFLGAP